jgi:anti-sigma-K factor RskA
MWRVAIVSTAVLTAIGLVAAGVAVNRLQRQIGAATARVTKAEQQAQAATEAASQQIAAARDDATRQIADARAEAIKARTISGVLAAPDLVRYNLAGRDATALSSAQALWSRSRGFVFSGSRLPPPRPDLVYQIWLLTNGEAISAGLFVPDQAGRFTLATDALPPFTRPVTGVAVTAEFPGGRDMPTGTLVLARTQ